MTEAAVIGSSSNGGLCRRWSPLMEEAVGLRDDDAMTLATIASLADGGVSDGGRRCQLCSAG
jgi:hypothetical protein